MVASLGGDGCQYIICVRASLEDLQGLGGRSRWYRSEDLLGAPSERTTRSGRPGETDIADMADMKACNWMQYNRLRHGATTRAGVIGCQRSVTAVRDRERASLCLMVLALRRLRALACAVDTAERSHSALRTWHAGALPHVAKGFSVSQTPGPAWIAGNKPSTTRGPTAAERLAV